MKRELGLDLPPSRYAVVASYGMAWSLRAQEPATNGTADISTVHALVLTEEEEALEIALDPDEYHEAKWMDMDEVLAGVDRFHPCLRQAIKDLKVRRALDALMAAAPLKDVAAAASREFPGTLSHRAIELAEAVRFATVAEPSIAMTFDPAAQVYRRTDNTARAEAAAAAGKGAADGGGPGGVANGPAAKEPAPAPAPAAEEGTNKRRKVVPAPPTTVPLPVEPGHAQLLVTWVKRHCEHGAKHSKHAARVYLFGSRGQQAADLLAAAAECPTEFFVGLAGEGTAASLSGAASAATAHDEREHAEVHALGEDLRSIAVDGASVAIMERTFETVPARNRSALVHKLFKGLLPGGVLIMNEAVRSTHPHFELMRRGGSGGGGGDGSSSDGGVGECMLEDDEFAPWTEGQITELLWKAGFDFYVTVAKSADVSTVVAMKRADKKKSKATPSKVGAAAMASPG